MSDAARQQRDIARRLEQTQVAERPYTNYGPTKPTSPVLNVPFFDTTIDMWIYWDGTRWLTAEVFENNLPPYSRNPMPIAAGSGTVVLLSPQRTDYASYYIRGKAYMDVATTNNATNYWAFSLLVGSTVVWNANTSADAAGTAINKEHNVEQVCAGASYASGVVTKTLSPGTIVLHLTYWYRLIIT